LKSWISHSNVSGGGGADGKKKKPGEGGGIDGRLKSSRALLPWQAFGKGRLKTRTEPRGEQTQPGFEEKKKKRKTVWGGFVPSILGGGLKKKTLKRERGGKGGQ